MRRRASASDCAALFAVTFLVACAGETPTNEPSTPPEEASEDERGSVGPASPAAMYCKDLGYEVEGDQCTFPDGKSCEQWSFFRAECGQERSYCTTHGGSVAYESMDMGGWTASVALCTLDGKKCKNDDFWRNAKCE